MSETPPGSAPGPAPRPAHEVLDEVVGELQTPDVTLPAAERHADVVQRDETSEIAGLIEERVEILESIDGGQKDPGLRKRLAEIDRALGEVYRGTQGS